MRYRGLIALRHLTPSHGAVSLGAMRLMGDLRPLAAAALAVCAAAPGDSAFSLGGVCPFGGGTADAGMVQSHTRKRCSTP